MKATVVKWRLPLKFALPSGHIFDSNGTHIATLEGANQDCPGPWRSRDMLQAWGNGITIAVNAHDAMQEQNRKLTEALKAFVLMFPCLHGQRIVGCVRCDACAVLTEEAK